MAKALHCLLSQLHATSHTVINSRIHTDFPGKAPVRTFGQILPGELAFFCVYIGNFVKSMDMKQIFEKCLDKKTVITETQLLLAKNNHGNNI